MDLQINPKPIELGESVFYPITRSIEKNQFICYKLGTVRQLATPKKYTQVHPIDKKKAIQFGVKKPLQYYQLGKREFFKLCTAKQHPSLFVRFEYIYYPCHIIKTMANYHFYISYDHYHNTAYDSKVPMEDLIILINDYIVGIRNCNESNETALSKRKLENVNVDDSDGDDDSDDSTGDNIESDNKKIKIEEEAKSEKKNSNEMDKEMLPEIKSTHGLVAKEESAIKKDSEELAIKMDSKEIVSKELQAPVASISELVPNEELAIKMDSKEIISTEIQAPVASNSEIVPNEELAIKMDLEEIISTEIQAPVASISEIVPNEETAIKMDLEEIVSKEIQAPVESLQELVPTEETAIKMDLEVENTNEMQQKVIPTDENLKLETKNQEDKSTGKSKAANKDNLHLAFKDRNWDEKVIKSFSYLVRETDIYDDLYDFSDDEY